MSRSTTVLEFIGALAVCELAGVIGAIFTTPQIATWYQTLVKPSFTPPSWLFGPVWTTLFFLMGISLFLVLRQRKEGIALTPAMYFFTAQWILNVLWSFLFFGLESPLLGLIGIIVLWVAIALTIREFYRLDRRAAYLLVPYIVWVSVAGALNAGVFLLNG